MANRDAGRFEDEQQDLNPHREEEQRRVAEETRTRLAARGVSLEGNESPDELADLISAVEEFEDLVARRGGDLMVDDASSTEPDDPHFKLPARRAGEGVAGYIRRIDQAIDSLRHHPAHPD